MPASNDSIPTTERADRHLKRSSLYRLSIVRRYQDRCNTAYIQTTVFGNGDAWVHPQHDVPIPLPLLVYSRPHKPVRVWDFLLNPTGP